VLKKMSEQFSFKPPRSRGLLFHGLIILVLGATSALAFMFGLNQKIGGYFVLLLLISLLLFAPLPYIIYRAYALSQASYRLGRDGLRLRWGLRAEDIPLPDVEWVRRSTELAADLPLPRLSWPGSILGSVKVQDLGPMEYLASTTENLLLVATPKRVYAISPEDPDTFLQSFQRTLELGSLTPLSSISVLPAAYLARVWSNKTAQILIISGFVLNLLLFMGVSLLIPNRQSVSLGFYPNGAPLPSGPAAQMLLLPILGTFIYLTDLTAGMFFFRREKYYPIAYLAWGSSTATAALLILAVLFNLPR
jgi:hypothetical protein